MSSKGSNFFNNILDITPPLLDNHDELNCYLATNVENMKDGLMWWHERCTTFPHLLCMARDYLSIPGKCPCLCSTLTLIFYPLVTTVDIEHVFSRSCLVLLHICNHLGVQSTHASLCVGQWSLLGLVKDGDIKMSLSTDNIVKEDKLPEDWDAIVS
jgi:hypothetical protein